ncbi:LysR substrate-binding domain-containing protein [Microbacterium sp. PA5]|uniref:LysR substrate-binding domain-containing protein n=1 Tax=Microbacterium sp. PA5 TaxID=3416654 RepID=UPI003CEAFE68
MAAGRGSKGARRPSSPSRKAAKGTTPRTQRGAKTPPSKKSAPAARAAAPSAAADPTEPAGPFRLGAVAGTTPGKWIDIWQERMPRTPLELIPVAVADQRGALDDGAVDAALVRLPIERDGLHVIALYEEIPVVVCAADSHLTAAEELTAADLVGEVAITPRDDVLGLELPGVVAPRFAAPETTEEAIATVAAGVGVVIVPMSLARLHHRKDVDFRPLTGGPLSGVALAWPSGDPSELVDVFVGIVRGRTANSSRG